MSLWPVDMHNPRIKRHTASAIQVGNSLCTGSAALDNFISACADTVSAGVTELQEIKAVFARFAIISIVRVLALDIMRA